MTEPQTRRSCTSESKVAGWGGRGAVGGLASSVFIPVSSRAPAGEQEEVQPGQGSRPLRAACAQSWCGLGPIPRSLVAVPEECL